MKTPRSSAFIARVALAVASLICCVFLSSGCTSLQTVPSAGVSDLTSIVRVGDTVMCTLRSGPPVTFNVTAVEPNFIADGPRTTYASDLTQLEIRRFSAAKTIILVAVLVGGGAALAEGIRGAHFALGPGAL
jgi:hypothetical protein